MVFHGSTTGNADCRSSSQEAWTIPTALQFNVKQNDSIKKSKNISIWQGNGEGEGKGGIFHFLEEQELQISLIIYPMSLIHKVKYMDTCDTSLG